MFPRPLRQQHSQQHVFRVFYRFHRCLYTYKYDNITRVWCFVSSAVVRGPNLHTSCFHAVASSPWEPRPNTRGPSQTARCTLSIGRMLSRDGKRRGFHPFAPFYTWILHEHTCPRRRPLNLYPLRNHSSVTAVLHNLREYIASHTNITPCTFSRDNSIKRPMIAYKLRILLLYHHIYYRLNSVG